MATTTPNYGWDVPTSSDYVKLGAVAIETLGDDIDASLFSITSGKNVGMVHINTTSFTTATTVNIDNVFTSAFDRYVVYLDFTSIVGTDTPLTWRLRTGGTTNTTSNYIQQRLLGFLTNVVASQNVTGTDNWTGSFTTANYAQTYQSVLTICDPNLSSATTAIQQITTRGNDNTLYIETHSQAFTTSQVFDGIALTLTGTSMTGRIRIYGLRNS